MTWQEAVRRAAQGGCPLLSYDRDGLLCVRCGDPVFGTWVIANQPHKALTAVMVALAWYWDKTDECTDEEYNAYMGAIRALRTRRAELEKELAK